MADMVYLGGRYHRQGACFIIKFQGIVGGDVVSFGDGGDQNRIRLIHQKRPHQNGTQKGLLADQRVHNMVQLRMTGKNIGLSQRNRLFAGGDMHFYAGVSCREMLLKGFAETGALPFGHQDLPMFIDDLDGEPDAGIKGFTHGIQSLLRHDRI